MSESLDGEELDEDSVFSEEIESNSGVCSNCYRKVKSYSKPHYEMPDAVSSLVEYEDHVNSSYFDDRSKSGRPSVKRSYCKCGNVDDAKIRPMDNRQIMQVAHRIEEHLHEAGIQFEEDTYYTYIREERSGSDMHLNEEKHFEEAIEEALITKDE